MRPATNVYDYVNHVLATVPKVSVVLHDPPSTGDTGFLALSRELDGHAVELFPGTRYNEGGHAYRLRHLRRRRTPCGVRAARTRILVPRGARNRQHLVLGEMLLAATQYLDGREPTAWAGKEAS